MYWNCSENICHIVQLKPELASQSQLGDVPADDANLAGLGRGACWLVPDTAGCQSDARSLSAPQTMTGAGEFVQQQDEQTLIESDDRAGEFMQQQDE